jgi:hypothetical protein
MQSLIAIMIVNVLHMPLRSNIDTRSHVVTIKHLYQQRLRRISLQKKKKTRNDRIPSIITHNL